MAYQYLPLQSEQHIRVLVLQPSEDPTSPLCCSVVQQHLDDRSEDYDAISYTWGGQAPTAELRADDHVLLITRNLDSALRRFRSRHRTRRLWADATCINQGDNDEKGKQIPLMGDIYRGALNVRAWLGDDATGVHGQGIRRLGDIAKSRETAIEDRRNTGIPGQIHTSIEQFLSLPWFSRRWIIQEVVLNTHLMLYCGKSKMPWSTLALAVSLLAKSNLERLEIAPPLRPFRALTELWWSNIGGNKVERRDTSFDGKGSEHSILRLLDEFHGYACQDPRDRLFALVGLASDVHIGSHSYIVTERARYHKELLSSSSIPGAGKEDKVAVLPDYSTDLKNVYCNFTRALIARDGLIATLARVTERRSVEPRNDFPSWMLDLEQPIPKSSLQDAHLPFKASGEIVTNLEAKNDDKESDILKMQLDLLCHRRGSETSKDDQLKTTPITTQETSASTVNQRLSMFADTFRADLGPKTLVSTQQTSLGKASIPVREEIVSGFEAHQVLYVLARPLDVDIENVSTAMRRILSWTYEQLTNSAMQQCLDSVEKEFSMLVWRTLDLSFHKADEYDTTVAERFQAQDPCQRLLKPLDLGHSTDEIHIPDQLLAAFKKAPQEWWRNWHFVIGGRPQVCSDIAETHAKFRTIGFVTTELQPNDVVLDRYDTMKWSSSEGRDSTVSLFLRPHNDSYKVIEHGWLTYGILSGHELVNEVKQFSLAFS